MVLDFFNPAQKKDKVVKLVSEGSVIITGLQKF